MKLYEKSNLHMKRFLQLQNSASVSIKKLFEMQEIRAKKKLCEKWQEFPWKQDLTNKITS